MTATINKGLLNKKLSLSIIVVLRQNFRNTFIKIAILGKIYLCSNCYAKLEQHWIKYICVHISPITHLFDYKKPPGLSISAYFYKNSLIVTCCRFEIPILTPNRFKNQANDTLKLLGHNYNHQRGFLNKTLLLSIVAVLNQNFLNTFILIAVSGKHYQWNSSY